MDRSGDSHWTHFSFDLARGEQPIEPIGTGKTLVILSSSGEGGFELGGVQATMNHLDSHIVTAPRLLGVSEHHVIRIEYQEFGDERHQKSIQSAHAAIADLVQQLTQNMGNWTRLITAKQADETAFRY